MMFIMKLRILSIKLYHKIFSLNVARIQTSRIIGQNIHLQSLHKKKRQFFLPECRVRKHLRHRNGKKWLHRNLSENHCPECLKLHKCWFSKEKIPKHPHHPFCHCVLEDVKYNDVLTKCKSVSAFSQFDPYLFNRDKRYPRSKEKLFNSWGYTIDDSKWLQTEIEKQGLEKYVSGNYELGILNKHGQRISIRIEIPRKNKTENVSFITGWSVLANGKIKLNTPYGGK